MRVLAVNAGSSSLKLSVVGDQDDVGLADDVRGDADTTDVLRRFVARAGDLDAVAHRIVHGGPHIRHATVVDDRVRGLLDTAAVLAPLHVPPALHLLDAAQELVDVPQVVCVDTAFHSGLPDYATTYAIPARWREWGVRRYGFHGLSYAWSSRRAAELLDRPVEDLQMLIAHVGSGVSVCAVRSGASADTSMGFTPIEGAVMAARSGSVDPGALLWLQESHQVAPADMTRSLDTESGLVALCGIGDFREIEQAAGGGDRRCAAALDVYVHVLCRNLTAVAASLDRLDVMVFTGGVGEHSDVLRSRVCERLGILGLSGVTGRADGDTVFARRWGPPVVVVAAREDAQMARETRLLLAR